MPGPSLRIYKGASGPPTHSTQHETVNFDCIRNRIRRGKFLPLMFRYRSAEMLTARLVALTNPFKSALLLRLLSHGPCVLTDEHGERLDVTPAVMAGLGRQFAVDKFRTRSLLRRVSREIEPFSTDTISPKKLALKQRPAYLRTDLWFGVSSGGSVGHIAGVLNELDQFSGAPVFLTTDNIPTVRKDIEHHIVLPKSEFWNLPELPSLNFNATFLDAARPILNKIRPGFLYQRYSINNFCGAALARRYKIPFVLEFNGSEIWIARNWGRPLKYEALSRRIEDLNLHHADLVVVVSEPIKNELIDRGIDSEKILVNPNGVDPRKYAPHVDGTEVRRRYNLDSRTVIGFIGTFGKWHGAEVLAEAFGRLVSERPENRRAVRLMLIGDGVMMPEVRRILKTYDIDSEAVLTGLVRQTDGPAHLAACDLLVSPHVPNSDGTPFFGSPTKLFEYMAMGKGIVASALDQIADVLQHNQTAWLVQPGSADALKYGLRQLLDDSQLRQRLGQAARREAITKYTWNEHTRRIIRALEKRCQPTSAWRAA